MAQACVSFSELLVIQQPINLKFCSSYYICNMRVQNWRLLNKVLNIIQTHIQVTRLGGIPPPYDYKDLPFNCYHKAELTTCKYCITIDLYLVKIKLLMSLLAVQTLEKCDMYNIRHTGTYTYIHTVYIHTYFQLLDELISWFLMLLSCVMCYGDFS